MIEIALRPGPSHANWHSGEEALFSTTDGLRWRIVTRPLVWRPPTDVYEVDNTIIVRVEIAGMREQDFSISLEGHLLTIHGVRSDIPERRAYHQMEIPFGEFSTEVELGHPIDTQHVQAVYQEGFLKVSLPKAQPQHIQIRG